MKKLFLILVAVMMTVTVYAGTPEVYIPAEQLPHLLSIMPAPPAFNSPEFASDEVRYFYTRESCGAGYARNIALREARGEWLLFADADDYFLKF